MRRQYLTGLIVLFLTLVITSTRTSAQLAPLPEEEEKAISILLDPHAGSNSKMSAVRVLMNGKFQPESPEGKRIVEALTRQAHYDMRPVRELCTKALIGMVGDAETARRIAAFDPAVHIAAAGDYVIDFRRALRGWKGGDELAEALGSESSTQRQDAMKAVVALAEKDPAHFPAFVEIFKSRLLDHLDRFDRIEPSMRSSTLVLVGQLASQADDAVPILRRALADHDPQVRKVVERFYESAADDPRRRAINSAIASALVDSDPKIAAAAAKWVPALLDDSFKATIARTIVNTAGENTDYLSLLKRYDIQPPAFARAVSAALWNTTDHTRRLALLHAIHQVGAEAQLDEVDELAQFVLNLLNGKDETLATAAAEFLKSPKMRGEGEKRIVASIEAGQTIRPNILKALNLEPEEFSARLVTVLRNNNIDICRAGLRSLLITGIKGDKVQPALQPLVRNQDSEIRYGAATLLNTPNALAEVKIPDLLADIRSNSISARQLAARQLDELNVEPKEVTAALVRAVEGGDFAARQGLLAALNDSFVSRRNPLDVLKETAANEKAKAGVRAFARAGLHEVEHPTLRKEARP